METKFTNNLKKARRFRDLTQYEAADLLGVKRGRVGAWEEGRAEPDIQMIKRLVKVYRIKNVSAFLFGTINESSFKNN